MNIDTTAAALDALCDRLIGKLNEALDVSDATELITDRQALRNITAALKDISDLKSALAALAAGGGKGKSHAEESGRQLTVSFVGETEEMSV